MPFPAGPSLAELGATFDDLDLNYRLTLLALAAFSTAWITAVGAAVGSFLNVVVYRLPQGMSLVHPKSRCPACGTSIRPSDNIPVLGWLRLRGRCRACGGRIAVRYPLVEAATATLFLGLAHFELFSGGANLPGGPERSGDLTFVLWHLDPILIGLYLYHVTLFATLLCLSLIAWDGFAPPRRLVVSVAIVGLLIPLFVPVRPVGAGLRISALPSGWISVANFAGFPIEIFPPALSDSVAGLCIGALVGLLIASAAPSGPTRPKDRRGAIAVGALIGLFLGWQAAVSCGLFAACLAVVNALLSRVTRHPLPATAVFAASVMVQVPFWRTLEAAAWWPGATGWHLLRRLDWPDAGFPLTSLAAATSLSGVVAYLAGRIAWCDARPSIAAPGFSDHESMPRHAIGETDRE